MLQLFSPAYYLSFIFAPGVSQSPYNGEPQGIYFRLSFQKKLGFFSGTGLGFPLLWVHVTVFLFSHFGCKEAQNKLFYSSLAAVRTSQQAFSHELILEFIFFSLLMISLSISFPSLWFYNIYKLPELIFATRWDMQKWLYFLLITAHFTDDETEAHKGAMTWDRAAASKSAEKPRLPLSLSMSFVLLPYSICLSAVLLSYSICFYRGSLSLICWLY